jgi:hypothetical protein
MGRSVACSSGPSRCSSTTSKPRCGSAYELELAAFGHSSWCWRLPTGVPQPGFDVCAILTRRANRQKRETRLGL